MSAPCEEDALPDLITAGRHSCRRMSFADDGHCRAEPKSDQVPEVHLAERRAGVFDVLCQDRAQGLTARVSRASGLPRRSWCLTTQRGIMATPPAALLRSWGRPSLLHSMRRKRSALPTGPSERGGPPPLVGLSPGLCASVWHVAYFTHRTVRIGIPAACQRPSLLGRAIKRLTPPTGR